MQPPDPAAPRALLRVRALTADEHIAPQQARAAALHGGDAARFSLSFPAPGVALLRLPTFVVYDTRWDWKGFQPDLLVAPRAADLAAGVDTELSKVLELIANSSGSTPL